MEGTQRLLTPGPGTVSFRLVWPYEGYNVSVRGTFNKWHYDIRLDSSSDGHEVTLHLPPGTIDYKFIVDGVWRYDPQKPTRSDVLGNVNNTMTVEATQERALLVSRADDLPPEEYWLDPVPELPQTVGGSILNTKLSLSDNGARVDPGLLPLPQHVALTHAFMQKNGISVTIRYREKFCTTVLVSAGADAPNASISPDVFLRNLFRLCQIL